MFTRVLDFKVIWILEWIKRRKLNQKYNQILSEGIENMEKLCNNSSYPSKYILWFGNIYGKRSPDVDRHIKTKLKSVWKRCGAEEKWMKSWVLTNFSTLSWYECWGV